MIKPDEIENPAEQFGGLRASGFQVVVNEKAERAAQHIGQVVQIGQAAWFDFPAEYKNWCKVGDKVVYQRHSGKVVKDPETQEEFYIVNDNDVQCIIKEAKTQKKGKK